MRTPLREFLRTETGGAAVLLAAAVAALAWVNVHASSYESLWGMTLSIEIGGAGVSLSLREWVNSGLMTFFFFVLGLEARREFDLGELRERRRFALPLLAAIGGMAVAVTIYLLFNAGSSSARGWGIAMSTDTAFALGLLALVGPRFPNRLRAFMLTAVVFDDLVALVVIATVYTETLRVVPLVVAVGCYAAVLVAGRRVRFGPRVACSLLGVGAWVALLKSGIDPVIAGLAVGLITGAYPPARVDLERVTEQTRSFREQPTPALARSAQLAVASAISPNDRLQHRLHPWTSLVIVPLFALANAGIHIDGSLLSDAASSPITWGILVGYVVGKPLGIVSGTYVAYRALGRRIKLSVSWPVVAGGGTVAGIGFTVALLIANIAFEGRQLEEAKLGILGSAVLATLTAWAAFRVIALIPDRVRARQLSGTADDLVDLAEDVDPERDHVRGAPDALVTLVEYGDYQCPYCGQAEVAIRELLDSFGDELRYVWRHLPLNDVHANAQLAAEAAEAASAQGEFWAYHDRLLADQEDLSPRELGRHAEELGLDTTRFWAELRRHDHADRIGDDVATADASGVAGTPSFFINGQRYDGEYDVATLTRVVRTARQRARVRAAEPAGAAS